MKFYSELTNELYETELALQEAEKAATQANKVPEETVTLEDTQASIPSRKQCAQEIEKAEERVLKTRAEYDIAKKQVEALYHKYVEETNSIMEPVKQQMKEAEQARYEAICKFNSFYGPYQAIYTGSKAANELMRVIDQIDAIHRRAFSGWSLF